MKLGISIVLYKTPDAEILSCLGCLAKIKSPFQLYIVDNSPSDSSRFIFEKTSAVYIHAPHNPGYGAAHNIALKESRTAGAQYHLVINADVFFDADVVSPMLAFMDSHSNVGQIMPKILNEDGSIQRLCKLLPTPQTLFFRMFGPKFARDRVNQKFELHLFDYSEIIFVPFLSGCFMLLRHAALDKVGLFDERFFMYAEDIDLTRRIAKHSETLFFPHQTVIHRHGAASKKSLKMFLVHCVNVIRYFTKWGWFFDSEREELNKKTLSQFVSIEQQARIS